MVRRGYAHFVQTAANHWGDRSEFPPRPFCLCHSTTILPLAHAEVLTHDQEFYGGAAFGDHIVDKPIAGRAIRLDDVAKFARATPSSRRSTSTQKLFLADSIYADVDARYRLKWEGGELNTVETTPSIGFRFRDGSQRLNRT